MGTLANAKALGKAQQTLTVTTTVALKVPEDGSSFILTSSGAATLPSLVTSLRPGRIIRFTVINDGDTITVTDTAKASATQGTITTGGGNRALTENSTLILEQRANGAWYEIASSIVN